MSLPRLLKILFLVLIFALSTACSRPEAEATATPLPPTVTAVPPTSPPTPTISPTPTRSLEILPIGSDMALPPKVIGQNPALGEEAALDGVFEVFFNQPMNEAETSAALQVVDENGAPVAGDISWPQPRIMRFKPAQRLQQDAGYRAMLAGTAVSATGTPLLEGLSLDFYTIGNLFVSQISPGRNVEDVAIDSAITVIFNRPVVPLLIAEEQANLPHPLEITPAPAGSGEWISTSVYVFRPDEPLIGRETYTVRVKAGLINEASVTGAKMVVDYESSFTVTAPTFNVLELVDLSYNPRTQYQDLPLDQTFRLLFNQPMDKGSTETAVFLNPLDNNSGQVPLQFAWNEAATSLTITPTQLLQLDTNYVLRVGDEARSAHGGRLRDPFSWQATTVKAPAILFTEPGNGSSAARFDSTFRIQFASPMDVESLRGKVLIMPEPLGDPDGLYSYWDWSLRFYGFEPSTTYTVQILPGMADPYGNRIETEQTITFTTAPYGPTADLNLPYDLALYRYGGSDAIWVTHRNVQQLDVDLYQLSLPEFGGLMQGDIYGVRFVPPDAQRLRQQSVTVDTLLNTLTHKRFSLTNGTESLPPGFYFITLDTPNIQQTAPHLRASPLVMSTANVTLKTTATEAMVWVTDLTSGEPVANVPVTLYDDTFQPVFQETTNQDGLVYRDDLTLETKYWESRYYAVAGDAGSDLFGLAISSWNQGISPYDFGISTDYFLQPNEPTTYVYTDRPMYRPGQPVYFKGIIRLNDDLSYSLPEYETVHVEIASYDETIYAEDVPLSNFGSFSGEIMLDDEAALGGYRISVVTGAGALIGNGYFDVAEYRKPTFQVDVHTAVSDVAAGETIPLTVDAQFFSGGSVVNGEVSWHVLSSEYIFSGDGNLSRYSFHSRERDLGTFYYYNGYDSSEVIAEGNGRTDSQGQFVLDVPADLSDGDGSRRFTIEATVTDVAGNQVSGRSTVIVHRSRVYPGIAAGQSVGEANDPMSFDLVTVDWEGKPVSNQPVSVEVAERRWYSVQEEDDTGRTIWRTTVEEIPVEIDGDAALVTDENGRFTFTFIPPKGGVYAATVTTQDDQGNQGKASTYVWVAGKAFVPWRRVNDHSFELISDRDRYQPGETAELLIASPFQGETVALVTVERGHIKSQEVVRLTNNSTIYRLPVTADMAPNVFVSVLVIKGVDETNPAPDFKLGMVQFSVEREEQALTVEVTPDKTTAGPGDTINYTVRVTDYRGRPVDAEVSLSLSDLAALSIADRVERPILDHFYSERWLSVNTATLLAFNMDAYNQELEDEIKGGGGGAGTFGIYTIREDFPDTAYWEAHIQTGADGEATVSVTLPDNLTTWRMDARAITLDTKVGQTTVDIVSTRPLLVSPLTPRFFVVGDVVRLGTAVHNNTDEALETAVTLEAEGASLKSPATQTITVPPRQQAVVTWEVGVDDVQRVDLVFSANSGVYADASRPVLGTLDGQGIPVYRYEVPETVGTSGQLLEGGAVVESIGLPIFPDFEVTQAEVTVEVAPSLAAAMTDGLTYLSHYEYECTEQIVSRFLPNLLTTRALQTAGIDDPEVTRNLDQQVSIALQRLYNRQHPDGGWPWWDEYRSNTLVTAYVVLALLEAEESDYVVSEDVLNQGISFLRDNFLTADGIESARYRNNRQTFLAYVLARAGEPPTHDINLLYETRESLDWYARAYLTQAILFMDADDPRLESLASDFISAAVVSAAGTHWEESTRDFWNWNSDTRTTAIVLDTMIKLAPENPLVANGVRWLMAHRTNGRWASTQETAWTLMSLTNWMVASGELEADFDYEIALNGAWAGDGTANRNTLREPLQLKFDVTQLFTDELNRLGIGRTDGPGNLYYTAHLDVSIPVEQVQPLDRGIILSRSYFDPDDRQTPITEIEQGETFLARLTIVVPSALHYVVIDDFLPAGLEAIDQSLKTSRQVGAPPRYDWESYFENGWGWWYFDHVELRDEKVVLSADYLPAGTYDYVYLVRAALPGEYRVIPPVAQEFYFPEVYGRGAGSLFVVRPSS